MSMTRNEFKQEAAIRCLQGLLANSALVKDKDSTPRDVADMAVMYADALTVAFEEDDSPDAFFDPSRQAR